jgi:hypothetical protein
MPNKINITADQAERNAGAKATKKPKPAATKKPKPATPPLTTSAVNKNRVTAMNYKPLDFTNPYPEYKTGIGNLTSTVSGNLQKDLARVNSSFENIRNQILAQYGNTNNQALLNARDLALAELNRQADDATRQVAANYGAAQSRQAEFAANQVALADAAARQNEMLANVSAGNVNAWNNQFGVTDGESIDLANMLANQAPREAALARSLGANAAAFENAMGTSIGEQQMALQGQIARDLANRSGVISTQTARDIAAAEMADRERLNTALLDAEYRRLAAEEGLYGTAGDRSFALAQAMLDAGLQGDLFSNDQLRFEDGRKFNLRQAALDEQDRRDSLAADAARRASDEAWRKAMFEYQQEQDVISNAAAAAAFEEQKRQFDARDKGDQASLAEQKRQFDERNKATDTSDIYTPPRGRGAVLTIMVGNSKNEKVRADADAMSTIASLIQPGSQDTLKTDAVLEAKVYWNYMSTDTKKELEKKGIKNFDDLRRALQYQGS